MRGAQQVRASEASACLCANRAANSLRGGSGPPTQRQRRWVGGPLRTRKQSRDKFPRTQPNPNTATFAYSKKPPTLVAVALFFGSFNPVHVGHCIIAEAMLAQEGVEEVWLVVSPQNPLKAKATLLDQYHRLDLVRRAVEETPGLRVSDIEFRLPLPSYTSHTLAHLAEMHPGRAFSLIMGADTLATLPKWRAWEQILADHEILIYPRLDDNNQLVIPDPTLTDHPHVRLVDAPIVEISATEIRAALKAGRSVRHWLPAGLYEYIVRERFYG